MVLGARECPSVCPSQRKQSHEIQRKQSYHDKIVGPTQDSWLYEAHATFYEVKNLKKQRKVESHRYERLEEEYNHQHEFIQYRNMAQMKDSNFEDQMLDD